MESFISTMETSALMGMNVARLVVDDYLQLEVLAEKEGEVVGKSEGEGAVGGGGEEGQKVLHGGL